MTGAPNERRAASASSTECTTATNWSFARNTEWMCSCWSEALRAGRFDFEPARAAARPAHEKIGHAGHHAEGGARVQMRAGVARAVGLVRRRGRRTRRARRTCRTSSPRSAPRVPGWCGCAWASPRPRRRTGPACRFRPPRPCRSLQACAPRHRHLQQRGGAVALPGRGRPHRHRRRGRRDRREQQLRPRQRGPRGLGLLPRREVLVPRAPASPARASGCVKSCQCRRHPHWPAMLVPLSRKSGRGASLDR